MKEKNDTSISETSSAVIATPLELLVKLKYFMKTRGIKGFVVGGYVRDKLLGRDTADIDIAIEAPALEIAKEFAQLAGGRFIGLDEANSIARVVLLPGREMIDFSTLRGSLENDLLCRDFTIDAMAINLDAISPESTDFPIFDPLGGRQDLEKRLVSAVTPHVFTDDPARLLRAVRLAAEYGFSIDSKTEELITAYSHLVSQIAGERIRDELIQLLALPRTATQLAYLDRLGLLIALLPEMVTTKGSGQPPEHHWPVFEHSLMTVEAIENIFGEAEHSSPSLSGKLSKEEIVSQVPMSETLVQHFNQLVGTTPRKALLKLACLLHDIGKPRMRSIEPNGRIRFLGHAQEGANMVIEIMERWRFSNREIKLVEGLVLHHMRPVQMSSGAELPSRRAVYRYFRDAGEAAIDTLFLSLADHWATRGPELIPEGWTAHTNMVKYVLDEHFKEESTTRPPKLLDGNDIMTIFGIKPGPALGSLLESLKEAQGAGEVSNREQALDWVKQHLVTERGNS
ncbi:MAG: HD domain-containing protein [Dehalococcoidia bacterium]|nr:HD domain-containing protein [Dehalococcoidia bacterium]